MDFFAGSGTTGEAVLRQNQEDGGNRRFILIEQVEEHVAVCKKRLIEFLKQSQIKDSFVYFELANLNQEVIREITESRNSSEILEIIPKIQKKYFLDYRLNFKKLLNQVGRKDFLSLSLQQQKQFLIETLDLNQLYVNQSEMADPGFKISLRDRKLTNIFYRN